MTKRQVILSPAELEAAALELVENALILAPDLPASNLAAQIMDEGDADVLEPLGRVLVVKYLVRLIGVERSKLERKKPAPQRPFPQFEHLGIWVMTPDRKRVKLEEANRTDIRERIKFLQNQQRDRMSRLAAQRQIDELQQLLAVMNKHAGQNNGITVREALDLE